MPGTGDILLVDSRPHQRTEISEQTKMREDWGQRRHSKVLLYIYSLTIASTTEPSLLALWYLRQEIVALCGEAVS